MIDGPLLTARPNGRLCRKADDLVYNAAVDDDTPEQYRNSAVAIAASSPASRVDLGALAA